MRRCLQIREFSSYKNHFEFDSYEIETHGYSITLACESDIGRLWTMILIKL